MPAPLDSICLMRSRGRPHVSPISSSVIGLAVAVLRGQLLLEGQSLEKGESARK